MTKYGCAVYMAVYLSRHSLGSLHTLFSGLSRALAGAASPHAALASHCVHIRLPYTQVPTHGARRSRLSTLASGEKDKGLLSSLARHGMRAGRSHCGCSRVLVPAQDRRRALWHLLLYSHSRDIVRPEGPLF